MEQNENEWNTSIEDMALRIKNCSKSYKWMHNKMSSKYSSRHKIIENFVTILGIITTMGIFGTAAYCNETLIAQLVTGGISVLSVFIGNFHSRVNYEKQSREHKYIAARWNALYLTIDAELRKPRDRRQSADDYIAWISKSFEDLIDISPEISSDCLRAHGKVFGENLEGDKINSKKLEIRKGVTKDNLIETIQISSNDKKEIDQTITKIKTGNTKEEMSSGDESLDDNTNLNTNINTNNLTNRSLALSYGKNDKKKRKEIKSEEIEKIFLYSSNPKNRYEMDRYLADNIV